MPEEPQEVLGAKQGSPPPGAEQGAAEQGSPPPGAEQGAAEQGSPPLGAEQGAAEQGSPPPGAEQGAAEQGSPPSDTPGPLQVKKIVPGILYLGHIPPRFRPRHVRNLLSVHGEVGRIFLQPEERFVRRRKKKAGAKAKNYTEGWVEFRDKRVAKLVAASLHNTPMGTRRRSRFHYDLWNIKYLHRFKWPHLSERLAYERQVRHQRLRAEISQAKRETNFYLRSVETSQRFARRAAAAPAGGEEKSWGFVQRPTEEEIQRRKAGGGGRRLRGQLARAQEIQLKSQTSRSLLAKIFNAADAASERAPGGPDLQ